MTDLTSTNSPTEHHRDDPTPTEPHQDVRERAIGAVQAAHLAAMKKGGRLAHADEVVDAVLAAVSAAAPDEREALDVERLRAFAEAVLALHRRNRPEDGECQGWTPEGYGDLDAWCVECSAQSGREYGTPWPCRTAALAEHLGDQ